MWSEEWITQDNHEYKFFSDTTITAKGAREACKSHGALLASIRDEEEQDFLEYSVVKQRTLSAFIGGSDEQEGRETLMTLMTLTY